jgi:hypothetical protein
MSDWGAVQRTHTLSHMNKAAQSDILLITLPSTPYSLSHRSIAKETPVRLSQLEFQQAGRKAVLARFLFPDRLYEAKVLF